MKVSTDFLVESMRRRWDEPGIEWKFAPDIQQIAEEKHKAVWNRLQREGEIQTGK
jgi:hypothetical protein